MANEGLRSYTKQIQNTIGNVASAYINLNKENANLHLVIPLITTQGPNSMGINLVWNHQDKEKRGNFGKGFKLSLYQNIIETNNNQIDVIEADGSTSTYEKQKDGSYYCIENRCTLKKDTVDIGDGEYENYQIIDQQGNSLYFDETYTFYPTMIQYQNGHWIHISETEMENGKGAELEFKVENQLKTEVTYKQDGAILYRVNIEYNTNQELTAIRYYKEGSKVKELSIQYRANEIRIADEILKDYAIYTFTNQQVTKIVEVVNNSIDNARETTIFYEERRTTVTDEDGKKIYIYFDENHFPLFELDEEGNVVQTKYDPKTKQLISRSSPISVKNKEESKTPSILQFSKTSGISTPEKAEVDPLFSGIIEDAYLVSGTGNLSYSCYIQGLGNDSITAVLWGKQITPYSINSRVEVKLSADGYDIGWFKKKSPDDCFELLTLGINSLKGFYKVTLTITLTGNASIVLGGIQIIKKHYGTSFQYDSNGNRTEVKFHNSSNFVGYNSSGLPDYSIGKDSSLCHYIYDKKGNMTEAFTAYGGTLEQTYDENNNMTKKIFKNASGTKKIETSNTYDSRGRKLLTQTNELGSTTRYEYDPFGKIKKITDALSIVTEYSYNAFDNLTKIIFNNQDEVNYTYDSKNNLETITLPNGTLYQFDYDSFRNINKVKMNGITIVSYVYDLKTGLIQSQTYGDSEDTVQFIYDSKYNIKEIKLNGILKYQYEYDQYNRVIQVKDCEGNLVKEYAYNQEDQIIKVTTNDAILNYQYNSLGEIIQKKRTLDSNMLIESFCPISNSKGFSPENFIGYLQGKTNMLGTIFNKNAELKNGQYSCKPYNYKTGKETLVSYTRAGMVPCILCGNSNPICYTPPKSTIYDNNGSIAFWFYPIESSTTRRYLFYTQSGSCYIGVYIDTNNKVTIEFKTTNGSMFVDSIESKIKLNEWNFFGLNFISRDDGQGYAKQFIYELYLNEEIKKDCINHLVTIEGGIYHIGYRFNGTTGNMELNCRITALMIGCRTHISRTEMKRIYQLSKDYLFYSTQLDSDGVDYSNTTTYPITDTMKNYKIYPLQNNLKSLTGISPIGYEVRRVSPTDKDRTFQYNPQSKRYAYVADGYQLEYDLDTADAGTILMRVFIREDREKQYFFEIKDVGEQRIGLYRGQDKYIYIEIDGVSTKTNLYFSSQQWHTVGLSFKDRFTSEGTYVFVEAYLNGATYSIEQEIAENYDMFYLSVGRCFETEIIKDNIVEYETSHSLFGQIEMLVTQDKYSEKEELDTISNAVKETTKLSIYDELGMLQKTEINLDRTNILTHKYQYKKGNISTSHITGFIDKETITYGNRVVERKYNPDSVGNITWIEDTIFGSHSYEYNDRGNLRRDNSTIYDYDSNGNITKAGATTFTYDSISRLSSVDGKEITYGTNSLYPVSYNGNTYEWEGRKLVKITHSNGAMTTYSYNEQGLRTGKVVNGFVYRYFYDNDQLITELAPGYRIDYLYDEHNQVYGFIYNNDTKYFYIRDWLQNILGIIDSSGNLVVKYEYSAYGEIISITGSLASTIGVYNPFRYKGYYYDIESDMYYCNSRYYNPLWCRFISPDSIEYLDPSNINGMNLFAYCNNDPVNKIDPSGHFAISLTVLGLIIGAVVGATAGGVVAYDIAKKSGAEGWELAGWTMLGIVGGGFAGGALGAGVGHFVSALTGIKGLSFLGGHIFAIKDTIALGHFGYVAMAGEFGFGFYQISPADYESMTAIQRWTINSKFLDDCAKLGANFAVFPNRTIGPDSTLYAEINYLLELGYQWTTDLSELIRRLF